MIQSIGMNAECHQFHLCDWRSVWCLKSDLDKYDTKKPALQSQLATEFANCFQMPDELIETF
jgi:hypothetical protein